MRRLAAFAAAFGLASLAAAQAAATRPTAIVGGTVHVVSGTDVPGGTVILRNGKIEAVGAGIPVPSDAVVVDAKGKHVYPTLLPPSRSSASSRSPRSGRRSTRRRPTR